MSYISHVDYKSMMENFKKGAPKQMLNEELEQEGNAFTAGLAKAKKGQEFKVGGKSVKDTSNYDSSMEESHPGMDKWYEDFENGLQNLVKNGYIHKNQYKYFHDALDHVDPMQNYGHMPAHDAAKEFVDDLRTKNQMDADKEQWSREGSEDDDSGWDDAYGKAFDAGDDFNDGEFWENEMKKLQELAGVGPHDDGPEDDDEEARERRAKKMEMDDEEAENAERDDNMGEGFNPDESDFEQAVAEQLRYLSDDEMTDKEYEQALKLLEDPKVVSKLWDLHPQKAAMALAKMVRKQNREDIPGFGGTRDALEKIGIREEAHADGSHMRNPDTAAKTVAEKHGAELKPLYDKYQVAWEQYIKDVNNKELSKVYNALVKEFQNDAINWCGHEMLEAGMNKVQVRNLLSGYGYFEDWLSDYITAIGKELKGMAEGLHMPPLQATGNTVMTNEDQAPFGMSVLSPDEREQLKEYINHYRTIKTEISKLLEKAGKSGKIMENAKKAEDERVPAERKAKYRNPTEVPVQHKKSNLGGNRTGLVMTKAEMWENEEHEEGEHERIESMLDTKLHDAFHKVTGMIMKDLMADGFDEGDIKNFLQHEIDEKAKEAINAQHDF